MGWHNHWPSGTTNSIMLCWMGWMGCEGKPCDEKPSDEDKKSIDRRKPRPEKGAYFSSRSTTRPKPSVGDGPPIPFPPCLIHRSGLDTYVGMVMGGRRSLALSRLTTKRTR